MNASALSVKSDYSDFDFYTLLELAFKFRLIHLFRKGIFNLLKRVAKYAIVCEQSYVQAYRSFNWPLKCI
jgi:hypothetical protein